MACCVLWNCWCNSLGFKFSSGFALGMDVFSRVEFLLDTLFLEPSTVWTFGAASGVHGHFFAGFVSVFLNGKVLAFDLEFDVLVSNVRV
jgi:hypothetical protein